MFDDFMRHGRDLTLGQRHMTTTGKKVYQNIAIRFDPYGPPLKLEHVDYQPVKLTHLKRLYGHEESLAAAVELWDRRAEKGGYWSVGFHCFAHYVKPWDGVSRVASTHGPCLQAVTVTSCSAKEAIITLNYRTSEFYKKFVADLIYVQNELMPRFNLHNRKWAGLDVVFNNVTINYDYFVIWWMLLPPKDRISFLKELYDKDRDFYRVCRKEFLRYYRGPVDETFTFMQTRRVAIWANKNVTGGLRKRLLKTLEKYQ